MRNYKLLLFLLFIGFISCNDNPYDLNKCELACYNAYNIGDTLIFKSVKKGNIKKYLITDKYTNETREQNNLYDESNLRSAYVTCHDMDVPIDKNSQNEKGNLLMIWNDHNGGYNINIGLVEYFGWYSDSLGILNHTDTLNYFNKKIIDYYVLQTSRTDTGYTITKMIWQQKIGIIRYDLKNGDSYIRTNVP